MASSLSNVFIPPHHYSYCRRRQPIGHFRCCVKAMGSGEMRGNLDHLQQVAGKSQANKQQPTRRRIAQSSPLGLWDRFPTAKTVQQMMDTMEDTYAYGVERGSLPSSSTNAQGLGTGYQRGRIPWEIKEKEKEYKLRFDMPGMTRGDVRVWVEERMLVIKAEKKGKEGEEVEEQEEEGPASSYGRYNIRIALPENVAVEKIKAEVKEGVLYITIPKAQTSANILDIHVQ